ncbi:hypothetical protein UJ50_001713 [Salmonella enterica subsp. enterica]|nr:hypothetical protein [Salmonella enterica subsp. enterica]
MFNLIKAILITPFLILLNLIFSICSVKQSLDEAKFKKEAIKTLRESNDVMLVAAWRAKNQSVYTRNGWDHPPQDWYYLQIMEEIKRRGIPLWDCLNENK